MLCSSTYWQTLLQSHLTGHSGHSGGILLFVGNSLTFFKIMSENVLEISNKVSLSPKAFLVHTMKMDNKNSNSVLYFLAQLVIIPLHLLRWASTRHQVIGSPDPELCYACHTWSLFLCHAPFLGLHEKEDLQELVSLLAVQLERPVWGCSDLCNAPYSEGPKTEWGVLCSAPALFWN